MNELKNYILLQLYKSQSQKQYLINFSRQNTKLSLVFFLLLTMSSFSTSGWAEDDNLYHDISAPEVRNMLDSNKEALLINVLSAIEYDMINIVGSINIPINSLKQNPGLLPEDKATPIIFYCMGKR
jgi:hypothetical protein